VDGQRPTVGHAELHVEVDYERLVTLPLRIKARQLTLFPAAGHADRIGGVAWHPQATLSQSEEAVNFATGAADGLVKIWSLAR
jgi:hypothetical protein